MLGQIRVGFKADNPETLFQVEVSVLSPVHSNIVNQITAFIEGDKFSHLISWPYSTNHLSRTFYQQSLSATFCARIPKIFDLTNATLRLHYKS